MMNTDNNNKIMRIIPIFIMGLLLLGLFGYINFYSAAPAYAHHSCCCGGSCDTEVGPLCSQGQCVCQSDKETEKTVPHITTEFIQHREWLIKIAWEAHLLPAMLLMTEQISTMALHQTLMIGSFFDAKHQMESQQLLAELQADAHKAYHPSAGMCEFGTNTRSIAASDRKSQITQIALSTRASQRQLLSGDVISVGGSADDLRSRLDQLQNRYCNPADMGGGFADFCQGTDPSLYNDDVNYTAKVDNEKTLEIDFTDNIVTKDEEAVLALSANIYGHITMPRIPPRAMSDENGNITGRTQGAYTFMKLRSLAAKRSVAQAALAAQVGMRSQGEDGVKPYMEAILKEMGLQQNDIDVVLRDKPSYYAQMELLTKKLYQRPSFYSNLYDKPVNIDRKTASMMALGLMQRRDMYESQLRSEMMTAVFLEQKLKPIEELYSNEVGPFREGAELIDIGLD